MTCTEIFTELINHMVEGIMTHEELTNYYQFLGLPKYSECHEKHYYEENKSYRKIYNYYIKTYNKLLPNVRVNIPQIIPEAWFQHIRQDVDMKTKQTAIKEGLEYWLAWEKETYDLYQNLYQELIKLNKIGDAEELKCLIYDVQLEISEIEQYQLNKISINYNMSEIIKENEIKKDIFI